MLKPNDVYKKIEDNWVSRFILDEVVIMPLCRNDEDVQYIYSISNETGSRIWQLLDGKHSVRDIQETLKSEYQGQGEAIEREVLEFLRDIFEAKLIKKIKEKAKSEKPQASKQKPDKKKSYKAPEIAEIKMQPEQAVLTCCAGSTVPKLVDLTGTPSNNPVHCNDTTTCYYTRCYGTTPARSLYNTSLGWS